MPNNARSEYSGGAVSPNGDMTSKASPNERCKIAVLAHAVKQP